MSTALLSLNLVALLAVIFLLVSYLRALALVLKGGTVMVVGVPPGPVTLPLPDLQDRQIRLQGSAVYLPEDYTEAIGLLAAGVVRPEDFVTAQYPLAEAAAGFGAAASGEQIKVVLTAL